MPFFGRCASPSDFCHKGVSICDAGRLQYVCGLDVHKKNVTAFVLAPEGKEIKTLPAMTEDLVQMADGIIQKGCTHVAMERAGSCWKPIDNLLKMENLGSGR